MILTGIYCHIINTSAMILRDVTVLALLSCVIPQQCHGSAGGRYEDAVRLLEDKVFTPSYRPEVIPLHNQTTPIYISVAFEIIAIEEVNDVSQKFICNGNMVFEWIDERLAWNMTEYGGVKVLNPSQSDVWVPHVGGVNTDINSEGKRNLFNGDDATISVYHTGVVFWSPGGVFSSSCSLDVTDFPFDQQECSLQMVSNKYQIEQLTFVTFRSEVGNSLSFQNNEWDLIRGTVITGNRSFIESGLLLPTVEIRFEIKRRPAFLFMNLILPVMLLSFLNLFVFLIPVESGEKISFGITVLLALSLFQSIISSMLPRATDQTPIILIFMADQLMSSVLAVLVTIAIVKSKHSHGNKTSPQDTLDHQQQQQCTQEDKMHDSVFRGGIVRGSAGPKPESEDKDPRNPRNLADIVAFVLFLHWLSVSMWFLLRVSG